MESSGKLLPQLKSENASKYAEKRAKFEEFRQQREREKQERLERIDRRKQELRHHRLTEIQKSLSSLQLKPNAGFIKQQAAVEKSQKPGNVLSTDIKHRVVQLSRGQPGSVVKKFPASKESARRNTIAARGLPSTAKKLLSERVRPRNLTLVKDENIGASRESLAGTNRAVKRHLLLSGLDVAKKPCLEPRNTNIRHEGIQMKNADKKLRKGDSCFETGILKSKNAQLLHEAVQPQNENNHPINDNGKRLTREQELKLWREKKLQQTTDMKSKVQTQSSRRRETLPAIRPGSAVFPTATKSTAIHRTSSVTQQVRVDIPKKKRETLSSVHVKGKIDSIRAKPAAQFPQRNSSHTRAKAAAGSAVKNPIRAIPRKTTLQKSSSIHVGKPELEKSSRVETSMRDKTFLSTVFSASEPATPDLKGPRMSTPYSSKHVESPCDLLQLSSIVGNRMKRLTCSWTPKTPRTPRSALSVKLEKWLAAHGKTPTRYRHLACYGLHTRDVSTPQPSSRLCVQKLKPLFEHDDCNERMPELQKQLIEMFEDATSLVNMGFPSEALMTWLNDAATRIPDVKQLSYYWSCKAHLAAAGSDSNGVAEAMQILEDGARNGAKPEEELETARVRIGENRNRCVAPPASNVTYSAHKRLANEVQPENIFDSSSVKFSLKRVPNLQPTFVTPQKVVVTPVRRSTRRSVAGLPAGLRDHVIMESVDEIPLETRPCTLFQSNIALNLKWSFLEPGADQ